ncbi:MAG: SpoIIE family protein phosphatase [Gemmatimonadales bacterium]|nr:SpoIIE family protein phosphatase [Gemmatimonadales bacterium]
MHKATVYPQNRFERTSRWIGLFLLAPILLTMALPVALHLNKKSDLGISVHNLVVVSVAPLGPASAAGLQTQDLILNVEGLPVGSMSDFYAAIAEIQERRPLAITVSRRGEILEFQMMPRPMPQARLIRGYSLWTTGLFFLSIGWWVLFRRPDPVARNFFALSLIFAFFFLDIPDLPNSTYMEGKELLRGLLQYLLPAYFLRFFLQFPVPLLRKAGRHSRLRPLLIPGYLLFGISVLLHDVPPGSQSEKGLEILGVVYTLVFFLSGLIIFTRRVFKRGRPIMHSKMLVVLFGLLGGLIPFLAALMAGILVPGFNMPQWQYLAFSLILVPSSFGLAILRYGALDKAFIVRVSLIYGLLSLLLLVAYFVLVMGLGHFLSEFFNISMQPVIMLLVAAAGLAILPLRKLIQNWIDYTFYPARRANQKAMRLLAEQLTGLIDSEEVIRTFTQRLMELYRPESFTLYLSHGDAPTLYHTWIDESATLAQSGLEGEADNLNGQNPTRSIPATSSLIILLDRIRHPVFAEELEDILFTGDTDQDSLTLLAQLQASLLVPMVTGNRLLGFTAFGPKESGELYSQEDLTHLHSLMVQSASLIESRQFYKDSLQSRVLEKELEVARGIQSRLLPDQPLATDSFTIAGLNESCRLVGGDYFDYFLRRDGSLGFAIADVAGKGVPAALQMTSLRATFRNLADTTDSPAEVVGQLNRSLVTQAASGQFVCFFFGIWDPKSGLTTYCNAGMDPPVLFRSQTHFRQSLKKGGPVLGVSPRFPYREGTLSLRQGDQIFLYTDGLTEETNSAGEFFNSGRLLGIVAEMLDFSPLELLRNIFAQVNEFGGQEKSDDKTAILLEINT